MNSVTFYEPEPYVFNVHDQGWCPPTVLCDIDGTVALHGDERGHYEYDKVSGDQPNNAVIDCVRSFIEAGLEVIFMSGREDYCRWDTLDWINRYVTNRMCDLFMRETGDHRADYIIKAELFDRYVRGIYDVRFVLDDRDQVVRMWRKMGLTCLQVADGNF